MPIEIDAIIAKMGWAAQRGLSDYATQSAGTRIHIRREATSPTLTSAASVQAFAAPTDDAGAPESNANTIDAPMAGICHLSAETGSAAFVSVGDTVQDGQTICMIEAMKVMTSITATTAGTVTEFLVEDGASVAAGAALITVQP